MSTPTATTIKLPQELRKRLGGLARRTGRSAHSLMLEAIERHVDYEERLRPFVEQTIAADRAIDEGGEVYRADDVHAWIYLTLYRFVPALDEVRVLGIRHQPELGYRG